MADTAVICWAAEETYWGSRRVCLSAEAMDEDRMAALWIKSVHAVAFLSKSLLLVREYDALWHFPGGRGEHDETPLETLAREMQEEAGATLLPNPCFFAAVRVEFPDDPPAEEIPYTAYCVAQVDELAADFSEEKRRLFSIDEASSLLTPLGRILLQEAMKVKHS